MMGDNNENTHVINELEIPVFCNGLKDIIVAVSPDGIMVCDKQSSEKIKDYANKLTTRPKYEEHRWGTCRVIYDSEYKNERSSQTKIVTLKPDMNIPYHIHHDHSEVWTILEGNGIFVLGRKEQYVKSGDTVIIPVDQYHTIKAVTSMTFIQVLMENQIVGEDFESLGRD